jgi:cell fate (sporulation/competence/biofilm development) regulator YlbF (YheA/YmcA/DUF963 family)
MVNTRSGSRVDQLAVNHPGRAPQQVQMDPAMLQFFQTQTQLLQNLTNTVANIQAQLTTHWCSSRRPATSTGSS